MNENEKIFTIPQAAKQCSINRVTLWRSVKSGKLKSFLTPGGHYRIYQRDLQEFMRERKMRPTSYGDPKGKKILIVDDEFAIRKLLTQMLTGNGYLVEVASDGFEAGIKVAQFEPDLVILDLLMPNIDGFEVCRQLKENPATSEIRIIVLTGFATEENRSRVMRAGVDAFLSKPVERDVILSEVASILEAKEAAV